MHILTAINDVRRKYRLDNPRKTRDDLTDEEDKKYLEDCFDVYEKIGFDTVFSSSYDYNSQYNDMQFDVVGRLTKPAYGNDYGQFGDYPEPRWLISIKHNDIEDMIMAYPEEICLLAKVNKTRFKAFEDETNYEEALYQLREWGAKQFNNGYGIFDFDGTGMFEIERIDTLNVYDDDLAAARAAANNGVSIIPVAELPQNFEHKRFGWIDATENRKAIADYCKRSTVRLGAF